MVLPEPMKKCGRPKMFGREIEWGRHDRATVFGFFTESCVLQLEIVADRFAPRSRSEGLKRVDIDCLLDKVH